MPEEAASAAAQLPFLPPGQAAWHAYVHKLRTWTPLGEGEEAELVRPYLLLVVSVADGAFLSCNGDTTNVLTQAETPTPEQLLSFLLRVMESPRVLNASMASSPARCAGRPRTVALAHTASARALAGSSELWPTADVCPYVAALRAPLAQLGCAASFAPLPLAVLQNVVRGQIEAGMQPDEGWSTSQLPGLAECTEGWTAAFGSSLWASAASFASSTAWASLPSTPLKISYRIALGDPADGLSARVNSYCLRAGEGPGAGEEGEEGWGLAIYASSAQAYEAARQRARQSSDAPPLAEEMVRGQSCTFVDACDCPFGDLDEAEEEGFPIASTSDGGALLPLFIKARLCSPEEQAAEGEAAEAAVELSRPSLLELQAFELALAALARLAENGELALATETLGEGSAPAPLALTVDSLAAKGVAEALLMEVQLLPASEDGEGAADATAYL